MATMALEEVGKTFADGTEALPDLNLAVADGERRLTLPQSAREHLGHEQLAFLRPSVTTMDPEAPETPAEGEAGPPIAARLGGDVPLPETGEVTVGVDTGGVRLFALDGTAL